MNAVLAQMVKAAGQRQHWKEAILMFDKMQEMVGVFIEHVMLVL